MDLDVHNPKLMFIIGCIGLGLNIISAVFLHGTVNGVVLKYHANSAQNMDMDMNMNTVMIIAHHPQLRHQFFTLAKNAMTPVPKYAATIR